MITFSEYEHDKTAIMAEVADIRMALGNMKIFYGDDVKDVIYYMEKRLDAIKAVYEAREADRDRQLVEMEKEYAREEFDMRVG